MRLAVIGLGLIGGSFCKALCRLHEVRGFDVDPDTLDLARNDGAIAGVADSAYLSKADLILVCLPLSAAADFINSNAKKFKEGAVVCDVCGVKRAVYERIKDVISTLKVSYVGTHPMAGREVGGYKNSSASIFRGRSLIITDSGDAEIVARIAGDAGFSKIVRCGAETHDKTIAYTSQLAHVVSNCYIQNPDLDATDGFTAGSFEDMTRVAVVDERMWSELFMSNRDNLLREIARVRGLLDGLYRDLEKGDADAVAARLAGARKYKNNE